MQKIITWLALIIALTSLILLFTKTGQSKEPGYIRLPEVYKEFQMTKELESELSRVQQQNAEHADSSSQLNSSFNENSTEALAGAFNERIWNQLNAYVKEYGEKEQLPVLLGADGRGAIMYGDTALDHTARVIAFINQRYSGDGK